MSKPVTGLTTFAGTAPPWNLSNLDGNIAALQAAINDYGTYSNPLTDSSGVANTITVNSPAGVTASYTLGLLLWIKVANTTTGTAVTVNLNGLGNLNVKLPNGTNPPVGLLVANGVYEFYYDGTNLQLVGLNPLVSNANGACSIPAPSAGAALTVSGVSGNNICILVSGNGAATVSADVAIERAGSTVNAVQEGPNLVIFDTTNATQTVIQNSGGQTEIWQYNGSFSQIARWTTAKIMQIPDDGGAMQNVGYRGTPVNILSSAGGYTLQLSDRGKTVILGPGYSGTLTIPASVFSSGDVISIMAFNGSNAFTIASGSGVTLYWAIGGLTTGNRTITSVGLATIIFQTGGASPNCLISGGGLS